MAKDEPTLFDLNQYTQTDNTSIGDWEWENETNDCSLQQKPQKNDKGLNPQLGDNVPLTNPIKAGDVVGTEFGPAVVEMVWEDIDRAKLNYLNDGSWGVYPISELKLGETIPLTERDNRQQEKGPPPIIDTVPKQELGEPVPLTDEWPVVGLKGLSKTKQIQWLINRLYEYCGYKVNAIDLLPLFRDIWEDHDREKAIEILSSISTDSRERSTDSTDSDPPRWIEGKRIKGYGPYFYLREKNGPKASHYLGRTIPDELRGLKVYYEG